MFKFFYVSFSFQTVINKQWAALAWGERAQLKTALYQLLLQRHTSVPTFVRNKLVKLEVDIARLDWPHFYPDFLSNILQVSNLFRCFLFFFWRGSALTSCDVIFQPFDFPSFASWNDLCFYINDYFACN